MEEGLRLRGFFIIETRDQNGQLKKREMLRNVTTTTGRMALAAELLDDTDGGTMFDYLAIGTGTSGAVTTDTGLQGQHMRQTGTGTIITTTTTGDTAQLVTLFTVTGNIAICEYGMFNAAANGTIWARQTGGVHNMTNAETLQLTYKTALA